MRFFWLLALCFGSVQSLAAQDLNYPRKAFQLIDSLQQLKVDTILYYNRNFVGDVEFDQKENILIYFQNGVYQELVIPGNHLVERSANNKIKSIRYFISLIGLLRQRDKIIKSMGKKYFAPTPVNGVFESAYLYVHGQVISVRLSGDQQTRSYYKYFKKYSWVKPEQHLLATIRQDLSLNFVLYYPHS